MTRNPAQLLGGLKRCIGAGGRLVGDGIIELQGDCRKQVEAYLLDCPHQLRGIAGLKSQLKSQAQAQERAVAAAAAAADNGSRNRNKPRWTRRDKEGERIFA